MNTSARVSGFALGLVGVAGAAALLGAAVGPVRAEPEPTRDRPAAPDAAHSDHSSAAGGPHVEGSSADPGGLMVTQDGYTLQLLADRFDPAARADVRFRIINPLGDPLNAFETVHGKQLHLIVVSRDLTSFQHVHPVMDGEGTWSAPLDLSVAGGYRVFADFQPEGAAERFTLGHDVLVSGDYEPRSVPPPARTVRTDGYEVQLDGDLVSGKASQVSLTVLRDGAPVTDLEPYLGAYGHLVALREGDLAYLHVHPDGEPGDGRTTAGPVITFHAEVPSAGRYRLFLDFQHEARVHTAAFTLAADATEWDAGRQTAVENAGPEHTH